MICVFDPAKNALREGYPCLPIANLDESFIQMTLFNLALNDVSLGSF